MTAQERIALHIHRAHGIAIIVPCKNREEAYIIAKELVDEFRTHEEDVMEMTLNEVRASTLDTMHIGCTNTMQFQIIVDQIIPIMGESILVIPKYILRDVLTTPYHKLKIKQPPYTKIPELHTIESCVNDIVHLWSGPSWISCC